MKMDSISYSRFLPLVCSAFLLLFSLLLLSVQRLPWTMINIKRELSIAENMKVKLLAVQNENQAILDSLAPLLQMRKTCIKAQDEQDASLQFRERIESAAKEFGIQIRNMGNVHKTILSDNMLLLEVSFSADGKTEDTVSLLRSMSHGEPRLFWESIAIKPVQDTLNITGTLCTVCQLSSKLSLPNQTVSAPQFVPGQGGARNE